MSKQQYTIPEMEAQILELQKTMQMPGVPADEIAIYRAAIERIKQEIQRRIENIQPPIKPGSVTPTVENMVLRATFDDCRSNPQELVPVGVVTTTVRHAGPAPTAGPITARIEIEHDTDPHNPKITITWSDGYTITVDETAARSNFTNRMRDTCNLKCVAKGARFEKIWKYDAPWRAAGFYMALTWFWDGTAPSLTQLGVTRPTETYRRIFGMIAVQAKNVL